MRFKRKTHTYIIPPGTAHVTNALDILTTTPGRNLQCEVNTGKQSRINPVSLLQRQM